MCDPVQITESMSNFQIHFIASSPLDHRVWMLMGNSATAR